MRGARLHELRRSGRHEQRDGQQGDEQTWPAAACGAHSDTAVQKLWKKRGSAVDELSAHIYFSRSSPNDPGQSPTPGAASHRVSLVCKVRITTIIERARIVRASRHDREYRHLHRNHPRPPVRHRGVSHRARPVAGRGGPDARHADGADAVLRRHARRRSRPTGGLAAARRQPVCRPQRRIVTCYARFPPFAPDGASSAHRSSRRRACQDRSFASPRRRRPRRPRPSSLASTSSPPAAPSATGTAAG